MNINQALKELATEPERIEKDDSLSRAAKDRKITAIEVVTTLLDEFPTGRIDKQAEMISLIKEVRSEGDSLGGIVSCEIDNLGTGLGVKYCR